MPIVEAPDGKIIEFPDAMPETEINMVMAKEYPTPAVQESPKSDWKRTAMDMTRTTLEGAGMIGGGAVGATGGSVFGPVGTAGGAIAGGGLGYAGGKKAADIIEELFGMKKPAPLGEQMVQTGKDVATGGFLASLGEAGGLAIPYILKGSGSVIKPLWGRLTGKGKLAIEESIKNSPDFRRAVTGEITGEEVAQNAKDALGSIVENRGREYAAKLQQVKTDPTLLGNIKEQLDNKIMQLTSADEFSIGLSRGQKGELIVDFSQSPLVKNQGVLEKAIQDVSNWTDTSAAGLDVLKKRLGVYTKQTERGSPSEAFLTKIYNELNNGLKSSIPGYSDMTKQYAEATQLIKDLESGLMLKKSGLSGRVVADQTLRRLMTALKENFELRGDLINTLSNKSGTDITGQVAGYAMKDWLPGGLLGSGPGLLGEGYLLWVNPKLWPVIAASSPKVASKFLAVYGRMAKEMTGSETLYSKALSFSGKKIKERQE